MVMHQSVAGYRLVGIGIEHCEKGDALPVSRVQMALKPVYETRCLYKDQVPPRNQQRLLKPKSKTRKSNAAILDDAIPIQTLAKDLKNFVFCCYGYTVCLFSRAYA